MWNTAAGGGDDNHCSLLLEEVKQLKMATHMYALVFFSNLLWLHTVSVKNAHFNLL